MTFVRCDEEGTKEEDERRMSNGEGGRKRRGEERDKKASVIGLKNTAGRRRVVLVRNGMELASKGRSKLDSRAREGGEATRDTQRLRSVSNNTLNGPFPSRLEASQGR